MLAVAELAPHVGLSSACQAFALNRGFVYRDRARHRVTASRRIPKARPRPPLSLSIAEQDLLLGLRDGERFAAVAPAALRQARAPGDPTQRSVVLGYHETEGSGQMDLLPS